MRRIKLVFATLVVLVAAFVAFSGPVMAQEDPICSNARGELIRCDGELYAPYSSDDYYDNDHSPFYNAPFYNDYPYSFYNDDYGYSDYPYLFDYGYGYYDEEVYEEVQEAQEEYLEDLADIYEEGYDYYW
jgi:hypothetical protein